MAMSLADKLALLRLQNGYSKSDLALRLGVSEDEVVAWEAGTAAPDLNVLPRLAALYSITVDALLNSENIPNSAQSQQTQQNYQQPNYQQTYSAQQNAQDNFEQMKNEAKGFVFSKLFDFADSCVRTASHRATARMMFIFPFPILIVVAYLFAGAVLHL